MHPTPHPVFRITDAWLLEYAQKGRGTHIVSAQRYDYSDAAGGHDYIDPDSGEVLTHKAPRGVLRAFNRLHAEADVWVQRVRDITLGKLHPWDIPRR